MIISFPPGGSTDESHRDNYRRWCQELFWNRQPSKTLSQAISLTSRELGSLSINLWQLDGIIGTHIAGNVDSAHPTANNEAISGDLQRLLQQQHPATLAGFWYLPIVVNARVWGWLAVADNSSNANEASLSLRDQNCLAQIGDLIGHYLGN